MLDVNPDIVCGIIVKAREFHAKEEVALRDEPTDGAGDWAREMLADHADDMTLQEVRELIDGLEPDQQMNLVALMWLGRGDYDADEWEDAVEQARELWTPETAEYLMARPLVADHLQEGLVSLGYRCED